jgi:hypothetical protein
VFFDTVRHTISPLLKRKRMTLQLSMLANPRTSSTNSGRLDPRRIRGRFDEFAHRLSDFKFGQGQARRGPAGGRRSLVVSGGTKGGLGPRSPPSLMSTVKLLRVLLVFTTVTITGARARRPGKLSWSKPEVAGAQGVNPTVHRESRLVFN